MSKPKIIVFTTAYHPFIGGAEIAIKEIAERLKDRFDFYPVRSKPSQAAAAVPAAGWTSNGIYIVTARMRRDLPRREARPEGTIIRVGFGNKFDKWLLLLLIFWNLEPRTRSSTSVRGRFGIWNFPKHRLLLWGVDISQGALAAALYKLFHPKIPFVFNIQYGYGEERLQKGRFGLINLAFRFILSRADYVTAISTHLLGLAQRYGYKGPAEVVPNGVDLDKFKVQSSKFKVRDEKIIITTSRLVQKNGIDVLIRAMAEVKKQIPDAQCHIIGDGDERNNLELEIRDLKLENTVKLFGQVPHDELPKYLAGADVFVRPSRSEGMGNSFVEALAAGLPIVGTPVGGITDIIEDGKTGFFARVDDPIDLAQKIIRLLRDQNFSSSIAENGRRMVEKRFSWDGIASSYTRIFEKHLLPRKILITTGLFPPEIGGPATYSKILMEELPKYGIQTGVLPFREVRHRPKIIRHAAYFLKILRRGRSGDVIFAQDPVSVGFPSVLAAKILRKKFLLKIVGDYAWEHYQNKVKSQKSKVKSLEDFQKEKFDFVTELRRKIQRFSARRAQRIIVPSQYLESIVKQWGINPAKIKVIYNSVELPKNLPSREEARKILGIQGYMALSAGRLVPWKGFEALIEILPGLLKKIPDLRLFLIGSGPQEPILKAKAKSLNLEDAVTFLESLPHGKLLLYLRAADVFLLNTAYEGMPHIVLEAMAAQTPVITTRAGGNPEVIENGRSGILVEYNNKKEWEDAIVALWKNKNTAKKIVEGAKQKLADFNKDKMIGETLNLLQSL